MSATHAESLESYASFVDALATRTLHGETPERAEVLRLLEPGPDSPHTVLLGRKAREMAALLTGNKGRIWSAVGIDNRPCPKNCKFCSFGAEWGLIKEETEWLDDDIIEAARTFVAGGVSWFVLRTTQFYSFERLLALAAEVRAAVPGEYGLVVNTGEFDTEGAARLIKAGVTGVYHTLRLGEGESTCFDPAERLATLAAVRDSDLKLYHMVEPLGPEHDNEAVADRVLTGLYNKAALGGVMARVNVKGTPYGNHEPVSPNRVAQVIAVSRVCGGASTPDICVHPPLLKALEYGANVLNIEAGAVPRSAQTEHAAVWNGFGTAESGAMLRKAGYETQ